jgi:hypothetical protein
VFHGGSGTFQSGSVEIYKEGAGEFSRLLLDLRW